MDMVKFKVRNVDAVQRHTHKPQMVAVAAGSHTLLAGPECLALCAEIRRMCSACLCPVVFLAVLIWWTDKGCCCRSMLQAALQVSCCAIPLVACCRCASSRSLSFAGHVWPCLPCGPQRLSLEHDPFVNGLSCDGNGSTSGGPLMQLSGSGVWLPTLSVKAATLPSISVAFGLCGHTPSPKK